jgi:hypothetical protein
MNARPPLPPEVLAFDEFLNEPPEYESQRMVREFRHAAYPRWQKALDALLAQMLAAQSPAPAAPAQTSQWQDISTAPKDADFILLAAGGRVSVGGWTTDLDCGADWEGQTGMAGWWVVDSLGECEPTHWQPLPPPPLSAAPEAK